MFRNRVTEAGLLEAAQLDAIDAEVKQQIERARGRRQGGAACRGRPSC